ncbi:MAG: class I SAM-dependent methyltransferase [Egibacteraceae bacterium]
MSHSWDDGAATYDQAAGHGRLSPPERDAWTRLLSRLVDPSRPRRILDVGTGTGFLALLLAELGHDVVGIDPSEPMLAKARAKATAAGLTIDLRQADAYDPGLPDGSVDVVVSRHVLWLLHEPERAVSAWARTTRPGGRIIDIDGAWLPRSPADLTALALGHALILARTRQWRRWPRCRDEMRPLGDVADPGPAAGVFRRAGLRDVRSEWLAWIDRVERGAMSFEERLTLRWRRYLVEGNVPG